MCNNKNVEVLDRQKFMASLKSQGIKSFLEMSRASGLHRNTINHYLKGGPIYQTAFLEICKILQVQPRDLTSAKPTSIAIPTELAIILDSLHGHFPQLTFVLFGSRARNTPKRFSDWDIGFFADEQLAHQVHLNLLKKTDDLLDNSLLEINLVNLQEAPADFLKTIAPDIVYLTGHLSDFQNFKESLK